MCIFLREELERKYVCEKPISPEVRLPITLYRFGRGDYCYAIEQMTGRVARAIRDISNEFAELLIHKLWYKHLRFPKTSDDLKRVINHMQRMCTGAFAVVYGTHIQVYKCTSVQLYKNEN